MKYKSSKNSTYVPYGWEDVKEEKIDIPVGGFKGTDMKNSGIGHKKCCADHHKKEKMKKVMNEFKEDKLHSGSKKGPKVTNPRQAVAIAYSESKKMRKK